MSIFEALLLGIVQGLTEFLPVSSSGHLELCQTLLGLENLERYLFFDIVCHLGTLLAILVIFLPKLLNLQKETCLQVAIGTLPLFPLVFAFKAIKGLFSRPELLGFFFLVTALLLFLAVRFGWEKSADAKKASRYKDPLWIGLFQTLALLPGVSRSGATLAGARLIGWNAEEAVTFSFLLAIPAILGSLTLEGLHLIRDGMPHGIGALSYATGFFTSFLMGLVALKLLLKLASKNRFLYFVWYCLFLGAGTLYYCHG